jgi:SAM-dependent methyltransferase
LCFPYDCRSSRIGPDVAAPPYLDRDGAPAPIDPIALYAAGIDSSDYVARVAPLVRRQVPVGGDLLDVGAGGGQLGRALREPGRRWTAIEPSASMRARLARPNDPPQIVPHGWKDADVTAHDTVLAANMPALIQDTPAFLARCRGWARRTIVWVVPAQAGPRGLILAGCLPAHWHGEDQTPGVDIVLGRLPPSARPHAVATTDWTFAIVIPDLAVTATYLADRLEWPAADPRRGDLLAHLARQAKADPAGARLEVSRKSSVLVWRCP